MYKRILHATDLAADHYALCEKAQQLAKSLQAELYILHVIEPQPTAQLAQGLGFTETCSLNAELAAAKEVMQTLGNSLNINPQHLLTRQGGVVDVINECCESFGIELVVVGKERGDNGIDIAQLIGKKSTINCDLLTVM